ASCARRLRDARRMGGRWLRVCAAVCLERQGGIAGAIRHRLPDAGVLQDHRKSAARSRMGCAAGTDVRQIPQAEGARHGGVGWVRHPRQWRCAASMKQTTERNIMMKALKTALVAAIAIATPLSVAAAAEDVVIVYDASGSMWGQIDGTSKIEIARDVMADLVTGWSDDINLGLVAYGHRSEGDCRDIETLIEPGPLDRADFIAAVNTIRPKGKTPISAAVQHAADVLSYRDNRATVVLISDGVETCQVDPCALAEQLARQGVKFTTHVVGFDLEDDAHASLACIAENTGGVFVAAQNAAELKEALAHVQDVMDLQPVAQDQPEAEPEREPQAEIELEAPDTVTTGASF